MRSAGHLIQEMKSTYEFTTRETRKASQLGGLTATQLTDDESKVLIDTCETGAVDITVCREITCLDTLGGSGLLRHLRDIGLLSK